MADHTPKTRAPRPGSTPTAKADVAEEEGEGLVGFRVQIDGDTHELMLDQIGSRDSALVRRETGHPLDDFFATTGADGIAVIIWLARRKNGERTLKLKAVESDVTYDKMFGPGADFEFEQITQDDLNAIEADDDVDEPKGGSYSETPTKSAAGSAAGGQT